MSTEVSWRDKSMGELFKRDRNHSDDFEPALFTPTLPQVNLLPPEIAESITLRKVRRIGTFATLTLLLVAALVWVAQIPAINTSQTALLSAQNTNVLEQAQVQALSPIAQMFTQIKRQEELVNTTLAAQPKASVIYRRLLSAAASTGSPAMAFTTLAATYVPASATSDAQSPCPNPDPFTTHISIGCVSFSATAGSREQVAQLLVALSKDPLFVGPYVNASMLAGAATGGQQSVSFTGTVGISPAGLATALSAEQEKALLAQAVAGASAAPGQGGQ